MLKKILNLIIVSILLSLVSCTNNSTESVGKDNLAQSEETIINIDAKEDTPKNNPGIAYEIDEATTEDAGIIQTIKEIRIFDNMKDAMKSYSDNTLGINDKNRDKVTIVIKFEIINNNAFKITTYPNQGTIITNSGEQVKADIWVSDSFAGEINEGVTTEGHILFTLSKTSIEELTNIKMIWNTYHENGTEDYYSDDYTKENKLDVTLK